MKKLYKTILYVLVILCFFVNANVHDTFAATTTVQKTTTQAKKTVTNPINSNYTIVSPLDVVNNAGKYLNKNISFTGEFVAFTSLGLDYKPAFREGTKYIGILIRRPDVTNHTIPLSEMKIFVKRELAEKNIDIEAGDKIKIEGKVFSTALGDPWVDASNFTLLTPKKKTADKK
ncbi:hypothetical protein IJ182_08050 [bacterium]|nr:hypothetical protein [bacterium]